jgi:hypothetical protein
LSPSATRSFDPRLLPAGLQGERNNPTRLTVYPESATFASMRKPM